MTKTASLVAITLWLLAAMPANAAEPISSIVIRESESTDATLHETVVPVSIAEVWKAISSADGWRTWAAPVARTVAGDSAVIETSYNPAAEPGGRDTIRQRIVVSVPQRLLAFRTEKAPDGFRNFDALARVTWLFELAPEGQSSTRVRLTGSGYPRTERGIEVRKFFENGNVTSLGLLSERLLKGPIDWRARFAKTTAE